MIRWYEIHQSELIRERLREADESRRAADARHVSGRRSDGRTGPGARRTTVAGVLGGLVGRLARG